MLGLIKRWLGLKDGSATWKSTGKKTGKTGRSRPTSATSYLYRKDPPELHENAATGKQRAVDAAGGPPPQQRRADDDFDPYNTGKFDRGASWEKISKRQR